MQWLLRFRVCIIVCLAVMLISAAVIFSVLRAVLPYATGYKNEIQQEISAQIGLPVEIKSIDAAIHWFSPRLKLIGVTVYDEKNKVPLFNFQEAFVGLDVVASAIRQEFIIDDIGLVGADISIEKLSNDVLLVQGIKFTSEGSSELPDQFMYMLQNADFLLHDSNIYYQDNTGEKLNLTLLDVNIDIKNSFNNHDIKFSMNLPAEYGRDLVVVADLNGNFDELDGEVYVEAHSINIDQWNKKFTLFDEFQLDAVVDVRLWVTLEDNDIQILFSNFSAENVLVKNRGNNRSWRTNYLAADVRYVIEDGYKNIAVSDLYYGDESLPAWGQAVDILASEDKENYYFSANFLRIQDLPPITSVFLSEQQLKDLDEFSAYGLRTDVYNLDLQLPKDLSEDAIWQKMVVDVSLDNFFIDDKENEFQISGVDLQLHYQDRLATAAIDSQNIKVDIKNIFREPLYADSIQGELEIDFNNDNVRIKTEHLQLQNQHINTFSRFDIHYVSADKINVDMQTDFYDGYGKFATHYLPVGVMSPALVDWLDMAVTDGYVPHGKFILHGDLNEFPYYDNSGTFQIIFSPQDVSMQFLEDWPLLTETAATVKFNNQSLFVFNAHGKTLATTLVNGYAEILNLDDAHLTVTTDAHASNEAVQEYIWQSALDAELGNAMRLFQFEGSSELTLKLDVPLNKDEIDVVIDGHLKFVDTDIYYPDLGYEMSGINGIVDFTEDSIFADSVDATIKGRTVSVNAFTRKGDTGNEVVFHLDGVMDVDYLLQRYQWIPENWISGYSDWAVDVAVPYEPGESLAHISVSSYLNDVQFRVSDKFRMVDSEKIKFTAGIDVLDDTLYVKSNVERIQGSADENNRVFELEAVRGEQKKWDFDIRSLYMTGNGSFTEGLDKDTQIMLDLEYFDLHSMFYSENKDGSEPLQPSEFPPLHIKGAEVLWGDWLFTDVELETDWHKHGMLINKFKLKGPEMVFDARGTWLTSWRGAHETVLEGNISSTNLGTTLVGLGFERSIDRSESIAEFESKWPAEPYGLSWANMKGKTSFEMKGGEILDADPGTSGRLLGLLNIFKIANRLTFDFDDVTRDGFSFDYIKGDFEFISGDGSLNNVDVSAPAADINMFGSIGMVNRDYGLLMRVKPHTDTLTFAGGALLGGVVVGAGLALIQKVFDLGVIGHNVYSITGSWDDPVIEKIVDRNSDTDDNEDIDEDF